MKVARAWARTLLAVSGIRVKVEGLEQIAENESYVFAANHVSFMDTPVVLANIPAQFRFLAKRGLFQVPFLGQHLSRAGHIPVPREDARAAARTMQLAADTIRDKNISLLIFPEGGRAHDGVLQPFKEGAAYIAIRATVPVVPVAIIGTWAVLPWGSGVVLPGQVTLRILRPIETARLTAKDRTALNEQVRNAISNELEVSSSPTLQAQSPRFARE